MKASDVLILDLFDSAFENTTQAGIEISIFIKSFFLKIFGKDKFPEKISDQDLNIFTNEVLKLKNSQQLYIIKHFLDNYYNLSGDNTPQIKATEKFLVNKNFSKFRDIIKLIIEEENCSAIIKYCSQLNIRCVTEKEFYIQKQRKDKLNKILSHETEKENNI